MVKYRGMVLQHVLTRQNGILSQHVRDLFCYYLGVRSFNLIFIFLLGFLSAPLMQLLLYTFNLE